MLYHEQLIQLIKKQQTENKIRIEISIKKIYSSPFLRKLQNCD
jgi:hypothetical protein